MYEIDPEEEEELHPREPLPSVQQAIIEAAKVAMAPGMAYYNDGEDHQHHLNPLNHNDDGPPDRNQLIDSPNQSPDPPNPSADPPNQLVDPLNQSPDPPNQSADPPNQLVDPPNQLRDSPNQSADPPSQLADPPNQSADPPYQSADPPNQLADPFNHSNGREETSPDILSSDFSSLNQVTMLMNETPQCSTSDETETGNYIKSPKQETPAPYNNTGSDKIKNYSTTDGNKEALPRITLPHQGYSDEQFQDMQYVAHVEASKIKDDLPNTSNSHSKGQMNNFPFQGSIEKHFQGMQQIGKVDANRTEQDLSNLIHKDLAELRGGPASANNTQQMVQQNLNTPSGIRSGNEPNVGWTRKHRHQVRFRPRVKSRLIAKEQVSKCRTVLKQESIKSGLRPSLQQEKMMIARVLGTGLGHIVNKPSDKTQSEGRKWSKPGKYIKGRLHKVKVLAAVSDEAQLMKSCVFSGVTNESGNLGFCKSLDVSEGLLPECAIDDSNISTDISNASDDSVLGLNEDTAHGSELKKETQNMESVLNNEADMGLILPQNSFGATDNDDMEKRIMNTVLSGSDSESSVSEEELLSRGNKESTPKSKRTKSKKRLSPMVASPVVAGCSTDSEFFSPCSQMNTPAKFYSAGHESHDGTTDEELPIPQDEPVKPYGQPKLLPSAIPRSVREGMGDKSTYKKYLKGEKEEATEMLNAGDSPHETTEVDTTATTFLPGN